MRFRGSYLHNPWVVQKPHPKQAVFLAHDFWSEGLYGGAAGGAKSSALLMAAAADVNVPGYSALLLRKSFADLSQPDGLIMRSMEWWANTAASYSSTTKRWTFPSGATITFGYLDRDQDVYQYQGAAFQFIGIDELTQHTEFRLTYLASRLRRPSGGPLEAVPLRLRAATNPGGVGHEWVKARYLPPEYFRAERKNDRPWYHEGRFFVPSRLADNPSLDAAAYREQSLSKLLPLERKQLEEGDWLAHADGRFKASWFRRYRDMNDAWWLMPGCRPCLKCHAQVITAVDPAGGVSDAACNTAIVTGAVTAETGDVLILDVVRDRIPLEHIVPTLARHCRLWRPSYVVMEDEFLQSALIRQARQTAGIPTVAAVSTGGKDKLVRATQAILRAEQGGIYLPEQAPFLDDYLAELTSFTGDPKEDSFSDQVDATAHLINAVDRFRLAASEDAPGGRGGRGL